MFRYCTHEEIFSSLETIAAAFAILSYDRQHTSLGSAVLVSANSLFEQISGKSVVSSVNLLLEDFLPSDIERQLRPCFKDCCNKQSPQECELVIASAEAKRWWRCVVSPIHPDQADNQRMIATLIEITEKKLLEQQLKIVNERYTGVVETAHDGIVSIDQNHNIKLMNQSFRRIFNLGDDNVIGKNLAQFIPERFRTAHEIHIDTFRDSPIKVRPMQVRNSIKGLRSDGSEIEIEATLSKINVGNDVEMTAMVRDISEQTRLIQQLQMAATHDPLTGIYNRRQGSMLLSQEIQRCRRFEHALSVAMIDLDHFKETNDRYGHACGDHALVSVVSAIAGSLRNADSICRWGGEEFLVILPETVMEDAILWAERARKKVASTDIHLSEPDQIIQVTTCMGLATLQDKKETMDELLKRADDALYHVKNTGRNQVYAAEAAGQVYQKSTNSI